MVFFGQLQLTYRPDEGPSEETQLPSDVHEAPPPDVVPSTAETETVPPPPPPPPQTSMDTADLLVGYQFRVPYRFNSTTSLLPC